MDKVLFKAVYNRKKCLLKNGTALVQVEAYLRGNKKYFSTNIYLTPEQWDKKHGKVRNHANAIRLNTQINDFIGKLEAVELERRNSKKPFTLDNLTDYLNGKLTNSFTKFMAMEVEQCNLSPATKTGQLTTLNAFREFRKDVLFEELNYHLLTDFERFLQKKSLGINTIDKYFRHIRKFVNMAINKDFMELNQYPFRNFKTKTESTARQYLNPEEVIRFENLKLPKSKQHLQKILDMFLFACYTGLRFSDITAMSWRDIVVEDGCEWLILRTQKTKENIKLPLYLLFGGKPLVLLERYKEEGRQFIFDDYTNQYVNRSLKELSALAAVEKLVTFHVARHTAATYLLYRGANVTTIQKLLGHKKLQTTQLYSKVMDMTVVNELSGIFR